MLAIIGLFVFIVPSVVAIVISAQARRPGAGPATMRTAGWARGLGIAGLFTSLILTVSVVAGASLAHSTTSYADLQVGNCFNRTTNGSTVEVQGVSCSAPHNAEAVGRVTVPEGPWPGPSGFAQGARSRCGHAVERYLHGRVPGANVIANYIFPERTAWNDGERTVICELRTTDGTKVSGPIGGASTRT